VFVVIAVVKVAGVLVLVLDTATPAVTAALAELPAPAPDGAAGAPVLRAERVTVDGRAHGELLAPAIQAVLAEGAATPADLGAIVAGIGPGPFTGLRIGLVTAVAMAHALGIPTYGVCTLDAIAHGVGSLAALAHGATGRLLVATDARRREVYWAEYADGQRIAGPSVSRPAAIDTAATAAAGDGAVRYRDVLGLPLVGPQYPPAAALAALTAARIRDRAPAEPLTPLYLRRPDAVPPGERKLALQ
jgi:tRNA threonylcarbamoyl adenosine modification protein YeaZ